MTKLPLLIGGIHLYEILIIAAPAFIVGFLAGRWWGRRTWRRP